MLGFSKLGRIHNWDPSKVFVSFKPRPLYSRSPTVLEHLTRLAPSVRHSKQEKYEFCASIFDGYYRPLDGAGV